MALSFEKDAYPGKPRILFIGLPQSTHTHGWIGLLDGQEMNVRLFALPKGELPPEWKVKTYITMPGQTGSRKNTRKQLYLPGRLGKLQKKIYARMGIFPDERKLAKAIKKWRPDIIHTLGVDSASFFFVAVRKKFHLEKIGKWVVQIRGGSDLTLTRHSPEAVKKVKQVFNECDQIISDNLVNLDYLGDMHIPKIKFATIIPVPGSGGIDLADIPASQTAPSQRERVILWPKAYECQWSKALPVLAAIQSAWGKIAPCEIHLLAVGADVYEWYLALPQKIRRHCHVHQRIRRAELLPLLKQARIMLAPSLIDGVPNSLYEAMAYGAFPIVSPLATITPVVRPEKNVLFARNLYPDEIAAALIRALNDDALVDKAAQNNLKLVAAIANRETIRTKVINYYADILKELYFSTRVKNHRQRVKCE